ncbi:MULTISPECIES: hypothetical protein [unclassified Rhodanobacter]|uniref:hypothetical protein n=1 Tax=unclassified Rhodanobacter TaxID=2621553 RepID=UPI000985B6D0|nr:MULTISPECIES: hypothetical protein [unclassified Rhodanobacter]OOG40584.1 hypothetical protein B0E51_08015 [Rhodanobacter sp. C05]OOG61638.1 hypothetical protein B0E46_16965 [Rhodanobacter sp. B04]
MQDDFGLESWLVEVGGDIIEKKSSQGVESLTPIQLAIYNLWLIDYAVRNSGSFGPLEDMESNAIAALHAFSSANNMPALSSWLSQANDEEAFCKSYYHHFPGACLELKLHWAGT